MNRMRTYAAALAFVAALACAHAKGKTRVACIGNSVTYGYTLPDRERQAYPAVLQRMLGDGYEVGNFGHSGATLLRRGHRPYNTLPEFGQALDFKADIAVIHLGLNDTDPRDWPDYGGDFISDYHKLIDTLRATNRKMKVYICLMTPIGHRHPRFQSGTRDWHAAIQDAIRRIASTARVELIDLHTPLYPRTELFPDALHPDPEGASILASTVYKAVTGDYGGLSMPRVYSDGMVVQRGKPVVFAGTADSGTSVTVEFAGDKSTCKVGAGGEWRVEFAPMEAGGPYTAKVKAGKEEKSISDIWVGEVWLCSGQSNMEFKLSQASTADEDLENAGDGRLHLFNMQAKYRTDPVEWPAEALDEVNALGYMTDGGWQRSSRQTAADFSAVAYHFGKTLADSLGVHIGLICNAVGGTTTESWIDRRTLEWDFPAILYDWYGGDFGQAWARERARQNIRLATNKHQRHPYEPAYMFEAAILPLARYNINGVVWYQGESNANNMELHERLFTLLEKSWRGYFGSGTPFYFAQLSSLSRPSWPAFRNSQRLLAERLGNTWMAVSSDLGDSTDVHPRNKAPLGFRLALQTLNHTYGRDIVSSGPEVREAKYTGGRVVLSFDNAGGLRTSGGAPRGFEIAGEDGIFHHADAEICGAAVALKPSVPGRVAEVRYGWRPFTTANLVNAQGLPASTFTIGIK